MCVHVLDDVKVYMIRRVETHTHTREIEHSIDRLGKTHSTSTLTGVIVRKFQYGYCARLLKTHTNTHGFVCAAWIM